MRSQVKSSQAHASGPLPLVNLEVHEAERRDVQRGASYFAGRRRSGTGCRYLAFRRQELVHQSHREAR